MRLQQVVSTMLLLCISVLSVPFSVYADIAAADTRQDVKTYITFKQDQADFNQLLRNGTAAQTCIALIQKYKSQLDYAALKYSTDTTVIKAALDVNGIYYRYLSPSLKQDKSLAVYAMNNTPEVWLILDDSLKNNKDIVIQTLKRGLAVYPLIQPAIQADSEVVRAAVTHQIDVFDSIPSQYYLDTALMNEVVDFYIQTQKDEITRNLNAVTPNTTITTRLNRIHLEKVNPAMLDNAEFSVKLMQVRPDLFDYLSPGIRKNDDFLKQALQYQPNILDNVAYSKARDRKFRLQLAQDSGRRTQEMIYNPAISLLKTPDGNFIKGGVSAWKKTKDANTWISWDMTGMVSPQWKALSLKAATTTVMTTLLSGTEKNPFVENLTANLAMILGSYTLNYQPYENWSVYAGYDLDYMTREYAMLNLGVRIFSFHAGVYQELTRGDSGLEFGYELQL